MRLNFHFLSRKFHRPSFVFSSTYDDVEKEIKYKSFKNEKFPQINFESRVATKS